MTEYLTIDEVSAFYFPMNEETPYLSMKSGDKALVIRFPPFHVANICSAMGLGSFPGTEAYFDMADFIGQRIDTRIDSLEERKYFSSILMGDSSLKYAIPSVAILYSLASGGKIEVKEEFMRDLNSMAALKDIKHIYLKPSRKCIKENGSTNPNGFKISKFKTFNTMSNVGFEMVPVIIGNRMGAIAKPTESTTYCALYQEAETDKVYPIELPHNTFFRKRYFKKMYNTDAEVRQISDKKGFKPEDIDDGKFLDEMHIQERLLDMAGTKVEEAYLDVMDSGIPIISDKVETLASPVELHGGRIHLLRGKKQGTIRLHGLSIMGLAHMLDEIHVRDTKKCKACDEYLKDEEGALGMFA